MTPPGSKGLPDDDCRPLRRGAGHREHGGPFPLPFPETMPIRSDCAVPRCLRQRLGRKQAQQTPFSRECDRAELTLQLCLQGASRRTRIRFELVQRLHFRPRVHSLRFSAVSAPRSSALDLHPEGLSEQEALTELLHCQDLYTLQPQHLADCDLDKPRVTKAGVLPKDAADLMSHSRRCSVILVPAL